MSAHAEWFGYPAFGYVIEAPSTSNGTFFCREEGDLVGSTYIHQPVYKHKGFAVIGSYSHKSCQYGEDAPSYDAIGIGIEIDTRELFH